MSLGQALAEAFARGGWAAGERWVKIRLLGAGATFVVLFGLLAHRAFVLQVRERDRLRALAEDQSLSEIELPARRGRILDRSGAQLAASVEVDSISANPRQLQAMGAVERTARALGRALSIDAGELSRKLRVRRFSTWVKRRVTPDEARAVRELALPGVFLQREPRRFYPNRTLGGPLLGWAGVDGRGLEGIELQQDRYLRATPAQVQGLRDALGRQLWIDGAQGGAGGGGGGADVVTTIDKFVQYRVERALEAGVEKHHARAGVAVALDPRNGEVLAMASVPGLNPNDPGDAPEHGARNRAVTDPFEPGSTMKTFSIAAAIEAKLVEPDDQWFCENGRWKVGSALIHDAEPNGTLSTIQVLARSSNICSAKIARRSGKERVADMLRRFGFGAPTGIDLPGERAGLLRDVGRWGEIELATIAFGQGVTATPLQVAAAYASIANGGTLYRPHVTRRIVDEARRTVKETRPEGRRVVSPEAARTMRTMLQAVMEKGGTGEKLAIAGYPAGGKTGTAQKVDPATRRYSTEKWASSFVGFAPIDEPRLVLFVMVDEPSGTHFGSAVAGPIWREVMADALRYLNVPPVADKVAPEGSGATDPTARIAAPGRPPATAVTVFRPLSASASSATAAAAAEAPGGEAREDGDFGAAEAPAAAATPGASGASGTRVPDFRGMSVGEALEAARRIRLPLEVSGTGIAVSQEPPPGSTAGPGRCKLVFAPPG